jgi:hypothetical protein
MAEKQPQTRENHAKFVPLFHYVAFPILAVNLLWALYRVVTAVSIDTTISAAVAFSLVALALLARTFALGAQDRVIRLEERLRMQGLMPDELKPRIDEFTTDQLVALRFASDEELPGLGQKVLDDGIGDRKTIKEMIVSWRADYQRL